MLRHRESEVASDGSAGSDSGASNVVPPARIERLRLTGYASSTFTASMTTVTPGALSALASSSCT